MANLSPENKKRIAAVTELIDFYVKDLNIPYDEAVNRIKKDSNIETKYPTKKNGFFTPQYKYINEVKVLVGESPNYNQYAHYIKDFYNTKADDSFCYLYNGNSYDHATATQLDNICIKETKNKVKPPQLQQFRKFLYGVCYNKNEELRPPIGKINMANGVLDVKSGKLSPHNPKHFFRYCLDHKYDADAECPNFNKFLKYIFGDDSILPQLTFEIFGYCLLGGDPVIHKAFLLYGEGRNGKSTWLDILRDLLGYENTAAVSMKLLGKPFSMVQLDGKLANIVEESPAEIDPEDFKNIVGGGMVTASHKGKPEYQLKIDSRLFFATNKLPRFNDATTGIKERLMIIPFNRYIKPNERDPNIKEKLKKEIPGIINKSILALDDFINRGYKLPNLNEVNEVLEEYLNESDSVYQWSQEFLEFTSTDESFVETDVLFKRYIDYCNEFYIRHVGINEFRRRINKVYIDMLRKQKITFEKNTHGRKMIYTQRKKGCKYIFYAKQ